MEENGIEYTIIMGQSVSENIAGYLVVVRCMLVNSEGDGPGESSIVFDKTGQSVKLLSVVSKEEDIFGYDNNYYQIILDNSKALIMGTDIVNQNIIEQILPTYSNEIVNYNPNIINTLKTDKYQSIIEFTEKIDDDIYIILPLSAQAGIEKIITFGDSRTNNINIRE